MSENLTSAYVSLLVGGTLIVAGGLTAGAMMGAFGGMMGYGGYGMMGTWPAGFASWAASYAWWMGLVGVLSGGLVLFAAYRIRAAPSDRATTATLAIVGGVASLFAMGGWIVGAVLSIVGGVLVLSGEAPRARDPPTH